MALKYGNKCYDRFGDGPLLWTGKWTETELDDTEKTRYIYQLDPWGVSIDQLLMRSAPQQCSITQAYILKCIVQFINCSFILENLLINFIVNVVFGNYNPGTTKTNCVSCEIHVVCSILRSATKTFTQITFFYILTIST